jgi:hypothetical protein
MLAAAFSSVDWFGTRPAGEDGSLAAPSGQLWVLADRHVALKTGQEKPHRIVLLWPEHLALLRVDNERIVESLFERHAARHRNFVGAFPQESILPRALRHRRRPSACSVTCCGRPCRQSCRRSGKDSLRHWCALIEEERACRTDNPKSAGTLPGDDGRSPAHLAEVILCDVPGMAALSHFRALDISCVVY